MSLVELDPTFMNGNEKGGDNVFFHLSNKVEWKSWKDDCIILLQWAKAENFQISLYGSHVVKFFSKFFWRLRKSKNFRSDEVCVSVERKTKLCINQNHHQWQIVNKKKMSSGKKMSCWLATSTMTLPNFLWIFLPRYILNFFFLKKIWIFLLKVWKKRKENYFLSF